MRSMAESFLAAIPITKSFYNVRLRIHALPI
jgi:hypothetical protein